jgi:hypothetical protein
MLTIAAGAAIAQTGIPPAEQAIAYVVFVGIAALGIGAPVVVAVVLGARSRQPLDRLRGWMTAMMLVIGANAHRRRDRRTMRNPSARRLEPSRPGYKGSGVRNRARLDEQEIPLLFGGVVRASLRSRQRGSVVKRGSRWGARWYDENGSRRFQGGFATRSDARTWVDDKTGEVAALRRGDRPSPALVPTVSELVDRLLDAPDVRRGLAACGRPWREVAD